MLYGRRLIKKHIKTDYIYKDIAEDVETRFDTSNYELDRPLPKGKNKKVIELIKDELVGKIMTKFVGFRGKAYGYLIDDGSEDKKAKDKKVCHKQPFPYENHCKCYKKLASRLWPVLFTLTDFFLYKHSPLLLENKKLL